MKLFEWFKGRQDTGYEAFTLIYSKRLKFDCYILRYKIGSFIPPHIDKVNSDEKHYRLNIVIWPAKKGGELNCEKSIFRVGPINFFRPDLYIHSVSKVEEGVRYVLSIGWIK